MYYLASRSNDCKENRVGLILATQARGTLRKWELNTKGGQPTKFIGKRPKKCKERFFVGPGSEFKFSSSNNWVFDIKPVDPRRCNIVTVMAKQRPSRKYLSTMTYCDGLAWASNGYFKSSHWVISRLKG